MQRMLLIIFCIWSSSAFSAGLESVYKSQQQTTVSLNKFIDQELTYLVCRTNPNGKDYVIVDGKQYWFGYYMVLYPGSSLALVRNSPPSRSNIETLIASNQPSGDIREISLDKNTLQIGRNNNSQTLFELNIKTNEIYEDSRGVVKKGKCSERILKFD